MQKLGYGS